MSLQTYNAKWSHSVNLAVQMDVNRETGDLLPNKLKLVVIQVCIHCLAASYPNGTLSTQVRDHADAAIAGWVSSKLERIGGEKHYKAAATP